MCRSDTLNTAFLPMPKEPPADAALLFTAPSCLTRASQWNPTSPVVPVSCIFKQRIRARLETFKALRYDAAASARLSFSARRKHEAMCLDSSAPPICLRSTSISENLTVTGSSNLRSLASSEFWITSRTSLGIGESPK